MKKLLLIILTLVSVPNLYGQEGCLTEATKEQIQFMETLQTESQLFQRVSAAAVRVPISFFLVRRSDGTGGLSNSRIQPLLNEVNNIYGSAGITFFQSGDINEIESDEFYNFTIDQENTLASSRDRNGTINVYVTGTASSSGGPVCGYTYFPPSADRILLSMSCVDNEYSTFAHELGHYFTLYHTHGKTNTGTTDEFVERVDCERLGDNLCDTPADPNLSGKVGGGCSYTANEKDPNGDSFNPDVSNLMSYAPSNCRNDFTAGQFDRITNGLEFGRNYLNIQYTNFSARFTASQRKGCAPFTVLFEDITQGGASRRWVFEGADEVNSSSDDPMVTYSTPGRYDVKLTAFNGDNESEFILRDYIVVEDVYKNVVDNDLSEGFDQNELPRNWVVMNLDELATFNVVDSVSFDDNSGSVFMDNYNYGSLVQTYDDLILPNYDYESLKSLQVKFNYSYTYVEGVLGVASTAKDSLAIGYSFDCESSFIEINKYLAEELATVEPSVELHVPQSSEEWSELSFEISKEDVSLSEDTKRVIRPIIRSYTGNGNSLYLDNFRMVPDYSLDSVQRFRTSNVNEFEIELRWFNPSFNETALVLERKIGEAEYIVIDTLPKNSTIYLDTTFTNTGDLIYYRIKNINNYEESSYSTEEAVNVSAVLANDRMQEVDLVIFPNPTTGGVVNIRSNRSIESFRLYDKFGRLVEKGMIEENKIFLKNLNSGTYFVGLYQNKKLVGTKKIVYKN